MNLLDYLELRFNSNEHVSLQRNFNFVGTLMSLTVRWYLFFHPLAAVGMSTPDFIPASLPFPLLGRWV